jgi:hypothetical protein
MEIDILATQPSLTIDNSTIVLAKGTKKDKLSLSISLTNNNLHEKNYLTIKVPQCFDSVDSSFVRGLKHVNTYSRDDHRYYVYQSTEINSALLSLELTGYLFSTFSREVDFSLNIFLSANHDPPVVVRFFGLDRLDVFYLTPPPSQRESYAINYDHLRWVASAPKTFEPINFQMRDREKSANAEFRLIITGIFLGVFASLLASILWDIIRQMELKKSELSGAG